MSTTSNQLHRLADTPVTPAAPVDQAETAMLLSALADGELNDTECTRLLQLLGRDAHAQDGDALLEAWASYHALGDCLRSAEHGAQTLASPLHSQPALGFVHGLRARMAAEGLLDQAATAQRAETPVTPETAAVAPVAPVALPGGGEAANASVYRWKMVAGVASLAAVAVLGWNGVMRSGPGEMRLADSATPAATPAATLAATATTPAIAPAARAPVASIAPPPVMASAPAQAESTPEITPRAAFASAEAPATALAAPQASRPMLAQGETTRTDAAGNVLIRNQQLDELLMRQYGNTLALQPPAPFLRNASAPQRGQ